MTNDTLSQYLDSLARDERYRVDAVLKESELETTQRVFFRTENGTENGPYIRKLIARDSGLGAGYERIFEACKQGASFKHIPYVHDYHLQDNHAVVVMEHINGPTLQDVVYERDPSVELAAEIFPRLCDAVSELHTKFSPPLIHRDLKPSNIVVRNNEPIIIDFGIAREVRNGADTDTTHFGTRAYAPPEQFGYGQTTERSDVYALGMLLYFLLVEKIPSIAVVQGGFADKRIPEPLRKLIAQATAFDPHARFASTVALKEAFGAALVRCGTQASANDLPAQIPAPPSATQPLPDPLVPPAQSNAQPILTIEQPAVIRLEQIPSAQAPAPTSPSSSEQGLGVRNWILLGAYVLFAIFSIWMGIDPSTSTSSYPPTYDAFMYIVFMPLFFALCTYVLMDKRRIRPHFPILQTIAGWKEKVFLFLAFIILILATGVVGNVTGAFPHSSDTSSTAAMSEHHETERNT